MNKPETERQQKVASLIQKDISAIFLREASEYIVGSLVSVTRVRMSPDLALARIYISVLPFVNAQPVLKRLKAHLGPIRYELGKRVGGQLRIVPEIAFVIDDSLEHIDNIDKLLKS